MSRPIFIAIFLGIFLSLNLSTISLPLNDNGSFRKDLEYIYKVTMSVMDDVKESMFTIKLKCRGRTTDILACNLEDPQYQIIYHVSPCNDSIKLCNMEHLRADGSYIGRFEIKYRSSRVERLIVSSETSLKQLSFYRIMAGHIFPGVDVSGKPDGTYPLTEESVYGKCEALVKVVRTRIKNEGPENERIGKILSFPRENGNDTARNNDTKTVHEMLSVKRTRNLKNCNPVPAFHIFDTFFYHPMMTTIHYYVKSSISRMIVRDRAFISYTTEDIAMKNIEQPDEREIMLHVRTTLMLYSIDSVEGPILPISNSISVELPFLNDVNPPKTNNHTGHYSDDKNDHNNSANDNNYNNYNDTAETIL